MTPRRVWAATAAIAVAALLGACGPSASDRASEPAPSRPSSAPTAPTSSAPTSAPPTTAPTSSAPTPAPAPTPAAAQLPRGGRSLLPEYRIVAHYGTIGGPALGVLGRGSPDEAAQALEAAAAAYGPYGRPVQPAMELIATVAQASPGRDGRYSRPIPAEDVARYLDAAHRMNQLLILDFQPGNGDFLSQIVQYEQFLLDPSVGVAVDPEWRVQPGQVPGTVIGSAPAAEINAAAAYVSALTVANDLPEKPFIIHQFRRSMLPDRELITPQPGLAMIIHADGEGPVAAKLASYSALGIPETGFFAGFKVFLARDPEVMAPDAVMALDPVPDLISYQ